MIFIEAYANWIFQENRYKKTFPYNNDFHSPVRLSEKQKQPKGPVSLTQRSAEHTETYLPHQACY